MAIRSVLGARVFFMVPAAIAVACAVPACSSSSSDDATIADAGMSVDTGTPPVDGPTPDAGPWAPSNFTTSAIANVLTPSPPAVDVVGDCVANTDDGTWMCGSGSIAGSPTIPHTQVTLPGAGGPATLWAMASFTLEANHSLSTRGSKPAIFYVLGDVQIQAPITVLCGPQTGGSGIGGSPSDKTSFAPGGGGYCGAGGIGASLADGGSGTGAGGAVNGGATLVPLLGGAPGGGDMANSAGGPGGGALQITALGSIAITSTGSILAGGLGGHSANGVFSGGGGAGGAILLEAPSVAVNGSLSANGGSGGDVTANGNAAALGTSQAAGGGSGGQGSGGIVVSGGNGTGGTGAAGGGGAGYIRINTSTPALSGIFSPALGDAGSACMTVGPL